MITTICRSERVCRGRDDLGADRVNGGWRPCARHPEPRLLPFHLSAAMTVSMIAIILT